MKPLRGFHVKTAMKSCFTTPLRSVVLVCCLAVGVCGSGPGHGDEHDAALARKALEQGQVLPLRVVLDKVEREYRGQTLKIEFEQEDGRFIYEIRLLQHDGRLAKLKIDARDGRVLKIKRKETGKETDAHPRR